MRFMIWYKISIFFELMGFGIACLIPLFWRQHLGFSEYTIGIMTSVGVGISLVAPLVFGKLGSSLPPQKPILWSFIAFSLLSCFFLVWTSFIGQTFLYGATQFMKWGFFTLVPVGFLRSVRSNVGRHYGNYRQLGSLGFLIGLVGMGYLTDNYGIDIIFLFIAALMLIGGYPFATRIKIKPNTERGPSYMELLKRSDLKSFFIATVGISTAFSLSFIYLPLRMNEMGASNSLISWVLGLCGIVALVSFPYIGRVCDRFPVMRLLVWVPIFNSLRVLALHFPTSSPYWFIPIQLLHIPAWVLFDVLMIKFIKERTHEDEFAKAQALLHVCVSLGMALGSALTAWLINLYGMQLSFLYFSPLPLVALPFLMKAGSARRESSVLSVASSS